MAQVAFAFEPSFTPQRSSDATMAPPAEDRQDPAFMIGWDYARHGEMPPNEHLHPSHPVRQGWEAGRARFAGRTRPGSASVRRWLALRLQAWLDGDSFEPMLLTPNFLAQVCGPRCPVSGDADTADAPLQVVRLNPRAGYAAGNLAALAPAVARAMHGLDWQQAHVRARLAAGRDDGRLDGLEAGQWLRLAALMSYVAPMPHALAASLPLHVLPTNRLRLLNAIQGLQALVTLQLARPAWSVHIVQLVAAIPGADARREFQLFFHCLLARVFADGLEADLQRLRARMEAAWGQERVQRRWERFALCLSPQQAEQLLQRACRLGLARAALQWHEAAQAVDGWGLADDAAAVESGTQVALPLRPARSGVGDARRQLGRRQVRQVVEAQQRMPLA